VDGVTGPFRLARICGGAPMSTVCRACKFTLVYYSFYRMRLLWLSVLNPIVSRFVGKHPFVGKVEYGDARKCDPILRSSMACRCRRSCQRTGSGEARSVGQRTYSCVRRTTPAEAEQRSERVENTQRTLAGQLFASGTPQHPLLSASLPSLAQANWPIR